ncbi:nuclear transport factor 2 family protein [Iodobacter fluviatilis]|uniref:SnoaL-like domain n=1 Tax=Iodobacter fluviatilis TaxID=537 RepID=A0A377QA21_9NEIS|nr:nuclear transport factor 2 family protein [Iodobacter fluviatilis]TCU81919.1 SnoaL-like protein [Iodobacter fluviatilis]STQ91548.1 SnoaL-like domain [Iodobacter fluviatilis]
MTPTEIRALIDQYIHAYNRKDVTAMLLTVHPDVEFKNIADGVVNTHTTGREELKVLAEQSVAIFSERHQEILSFESSPHKASASIAFRAVVADDLPNGLKKGQTLELSGRSEFEFKDGLIAKITDLS